MALAGLLKFPLVTYPKCFWRKPKYCPNCKIKTFPYLLVTVSQPVIVIGNYLRDFMKLVNIHRWSCRKVMFLHLSVILFTVGLYTPTPMGRHPSLFPLSPHPRWPLQGIVCILLECILVTVCDCIWIVIQITGEINAKGRAIVNWEHQMQVVHK